jgi:hypothetical protein
MLLICAFAANSAGGGKSRFSCKTLVIFDEGEGADMLVAPQWTVCHNDAGEGIVKVRTDVGKEHLANTAGESRRAGISQT